MEQEKKTRAIEEFRKGCTWAEVAAAIGIGRTTLWRWSQADSDFAAAIEDAHAGPDDEVEAVTFAQATDPDPANNTLRMFWLKSRRPAVYKERVDVTSGEKPFGYIERARNPRDEGIPAPAQAK
jgi:hypothetical protein